MQYQALIQSMKMLLKTSSSIPFISFFHYKTQTVHMYTFIKEILDFANSFGCS